MNSNDLAITQLADKVPLGEKLPSLLDGQRNRISIFISDLKIIIQISGNKNVFGVNIILLD